MNKFTTSVAVKVPAFAAFRPLVPELEFKNLGDLADGSMTGPFVYVLVESGGGIIYIGKSDAETGTAGKRALSYPKWSSEYLAKVAEGGWPDPIHDPESADFTLAGWAPIIRFQTLHQAMVKVASVGHTDANGRVWEARLQALSGTLTGLESLVGGSGWEFKPGTLRDAGYEWAWERLEEMQEAGKLSA
ncbi:hypothetical protein [Mycetocola zhujimingii]|uniref:hypothetical protein n=1 Tax=Mycetocola zhujimingii TaxID=2079792 RepID=UPI000D39EB00|nr:hypothetical protein [Mycetocola zhujimingii]AWB86570.1 hypothetical protein C3E77_08035 [Mycetocola zhujimingii]